jgi:hypothetical protein
VVGAAVEQERSRLGVGARGERPADQDRVVAAVQLAHGLAGEPGEYVRKDRHPLADLVGDTRELLLAALLRREAACELLLADGEHVDAETA